MPTQLFSTSGTWNCPTDFKPGSLIVQCWGAAGNGAAGVSGTRSGGGGGGGEFAQDTPAATPGSNYTVTVSTGAGINTTFVGDNLTVTAHSGGNASGVTAGTAGSGSSNATHFNGGAGGAGRSASNSGGAGAGSSAGTGSVGSNGTASTSSSAAAGGTAPSGGGNGGGGGSGISAGVAGTVPGGGGGGGGNNFSTNGTAGQGADGQVFLSWDTVVPGPPGGQRRRQSVIPMKSAPRLRQGVEAPLGPQIFGPPFICDPPLYTKKPPVPALHRLPHGQAPTGHPIPLQPPMEPNTGIRRDYKPPWPRRGVTFFPWPSENIPSAESYRRDYKPPWPRKGVVAPTGWPVPVQPPKPGGTGVYPHFRTRRRRPTRGKSNWPGTAAALIQPPYSTWIYKRRWTKPLLKRKGVTPPRGLPAPPIVTSYNPTSERRPQRYQWFRKGNVAPTGWPVPVQPPMTSQSLRRWYKPPWPRKGVTPPTNIPEPVPTSWRVRRPQKYQWFRRGRAIPGSGLPVPVQPVELPHSVRRYSRPLIPRRSPPKFAAFFTPVQPPERMQSVRRWVKPLFPRRGRTIFPTIAGTQEVTGYQQLPLQTFSYTPGTPGMDLTPAGLTLMPLNRLGYSFFNRYGNVLLIVFNDTVFPITLVPNVIRAVENQIVQLPTYVLPPGKMQGFGPFPEGDFTNPDLVHPDTSYYMTMDVSTGDSGVYAGAFLLVSAPPYGHVGPFDRYMVHLRQLISGHQDHTSTPGEIHPGDATPGA